MGETVGVMRFGAGGRVTVGTTGTGERIGRGLVGKDCWVVGFGRPSNGSGIGDCVVGFRRRAELTYA